MLLLVINSQKKYVKGFINYDPEVQRFYCAIFQCAIYSYYLSELEQYALNQIFYSTKIKIVQDEATPPQLLAENNLIALIESHKTDNYIETTMGVFKEDRWKVMATAVFRVQLTTVGGRCQHGKVIFPGTFAEKNSAHEIKDELVKLSEGVSFR